MLINRRSNEAEIDRGFIGDGCGHAYYRDPETRTQSSDYFGLVSAPIVNDVHLSAENCITTVTQGVVRGWRRDLAWAGGSAGASPRIQEC